MSWVAVESLDEALAETQSLLLPVDAGTWVRLAVVAVLAGLSPPQTPAVSWEVPPQAVVRYGRELTDPEVLAVALSVLAAVVVAAAAFAVVGAVMEFVLVDAVRSRRVRVLGPLADRFGAGLRLFGFRLAVAVVGLLAAAGVVVPVLVALATESALPLLALLVTVPLLLVAGAASSLALEFTTAFVVPLMAEHGGGVVEGWRRFWPTLRAEWREFAVYVLVKLVLLVGAGVVLSLVGAIIAVPAGLVLFAGGLSPVAVLAVAAAVVVGLVVLGAVSVPLVTYLRYHSLCTLAASGAEFTLR